MKKLIRNRDTKAFLSDSGQWTADCHRAEVFSTPEAARETVSRQGLANVELYYLYGEEPSEYDFTIPLG